VIRKTPAALEVLRVYLPPEIAKRFHAAVARAAGDRHYSQEQRANLKELSAALEKP